MSAAWARSVRPVPPPRRRVDWPLVAAWLIAVFAPWLVILATLAFLLDWWPW
jgi:hypothetical protein